MSKKILLMTMGGTHEILERAVKSKNYNTIFIITTEDFIKELKAKGKELSNYKVKLKYEIIKDKEDPDVTYKKADEIIKSLKEKKIQTYEIEINYTGGTKSMSAGIVIAGRDNNIRRLIYTGGKRGTDHKVKSGFENDYLVPLPSITLSNYYNFIKLLFNNHDFYAAIKYIEHIEKNMGIKKEQEEFLNFLYEISNVYLLWASMNYKEAAEGISKIKLSETIRKELSIGLDFEENLNRNKMILNRTFKSKFFQILDKYSAAKRYFEDGYFLITVELLYSVAEFVADYILERDYNLNKQDIDEKRAKEIAQSAGNNLPENYFEQSRSKTNKKIQLPLYTSYDLLCKFNNNIGKQFMENKRYQDTIKIRNEMIHGNKTVIRHHAEEFISETYKFLKDFCKQYSEDKEKDIEKLLKNYEFIKI